MSERVIDLSSRHGRAACADHGNWGPGRLLLAELLLDRGYEVFGTVRDECADYAEHRSDPRRRRARGRRPARPGLPRQDAEARAPDEVYNLAASSFVPMSWEQPVRTAELAAVGATALPRRSGLDRRTSVFTSVVERDLRRAARDAAERAHAARAGDSVRRRQGVRALHHALVSQPVRACTRRRGSSTTTSRPGARSSSCRGRSRTGCIDQARAHRGRVAWRSQRTTRLGLRGRLRARDVADAAAGRAGRLRDRDRRDAQRPGARDRARSTASSSTGGRTCTSTSR